MNLSVRIIHLRNYFKDLIILVLEVCSTRVLNFHILVRIYHHKLLDEGEARCCKIYLNRLL
jgi:hypothetical protein